MIGERNLMNEEKQMRYVYVFCVLLILELTFFGLAIYFTNDVQFKSVYLLHGSASLLGNFFLVEGIIIKNFVQISLYPIIYLFTFANTFLGSSRETGLYFVFKMAQVGVYVVRGFILYHVFYRLRLEFAWHSFKRLGTSTQVIGKFVF
ncbi:putative transporter [Trachipleistophora hominis]|uniref:Putative transporter n=1 Tax=Trachipleistophora hominis TaxID=72359 RepID=L7JZT7_TRAHO|nr:putative transporter [Trachipleistophora hominis]